MFGKISAWTILIWVLDYAAVGLGMLATLHLYFVITFSLNVFL